MCRKLHFKSCLEHVTVNTCGCNPQGNMATMTALTLNNRDSESALGKPDFQWISIIQQPGSDRELHSDCGNQKADFFYICTPSLSFLVWWLLLSLKFYFSLMHIFVPSHKSLTSIFFFCIRAVFVYFPWYFTLLQYFSLCRFWLEFRLCYPWICVFACRLDRFFIVVVLSVCWWCLSNAPLGFFLSHNWLLSAIISLLSVTVSITSFLLHANILNHTHSTFQIILFTCFS